MAKDKITDYDPTAANNADVGGVNIQGSASVTLGDNALREILSHLAETNAGTYPVTSTWSFGDSGDLTKKTRFKGDNITTGTTWPVFVGKGADVASATTTTLGSGNFFHITGTTTITDIDFTDAYNGRWAILEFDDILTLTHNSTTLVLPGGLDIVTAAGDRAFIIQDSGDNIHVMFYQRAATRPSSSKTATSITAGGTSDDFTGLPAGIKRLVISWITLSTNGSTVPLVQIGDSGGLENSGYVGLTSTLTETPGIAGDAHSTGVPLTHSSGTAAGTTQTGQLEFIRLDAAGYAWVYRGQGAASNADNQYLMVGTKTLTAELDRISIVYGADSADNGTIGLYYEW